MFKTLEILKMKVQNHAGPIQLTCSFSFGPKFSSAYIRPVAIARFSLVTEEHLRLLDFSVFTPSVTYKKSSKKMYKQSVYLDKPCIYRHRCAYE